ncbi:hypothetical protein BB560_006182, partial [Smittium megazygosporum]
WGFKMSDSKEKSNLPGFVKEPYVEDRSRLELLYVLWEATTGIYICDPWEKFLY